MTRVLGLDIGMSGARAAVLDEHGTRLGTGRARCAHAPVAAGLAEHDPQAWIDEAGAAAREAVAEAGIERVDAIAVGALGPAPVLLDADLQPLLPAPLFSLDPRAEGHRRTLVDLGTDVGPDHVRPRLLAWAETEADAFERAAWAIDATGFLVGTLIGRPVIDRITAADHLIQGSPPPVPMPAPEEPLAVAGPLREAGADALGIAPGAPVAVGTYDTFVDVAALPHGTGDVALLLGSTLVLGTVVDGATPEVPEGLRASSHVGTGAFVGGWTSTAGSALDWGVATFGDGDTTSVLDAAVASEPGGAGLLAWTGLAGERAPVWDPLARGVLLGLTTTSTPLEIVRAILDGVALSTMDLFDRLHPLIGEAPRIFVAGGGARNAAWLRVTADALGVPLHAARELADAGAAARFALRVASVDAPPVETVTVEPDAENHRRYRELRPIHAELYPALVGAMHRLAVLGARERRP